MLLPRIASALLALIILTSSQGSAQVRLKVLGWNVEARGSSSSAIAELLKKFEGFDIVGLCEVRPGDFGRFRSAVAWGEGANNQDPSFRYIPGSTGGEVFRLLIVYDTRRLRLIGDPQELHHINADDRGHRSPLVARFKLEDTGDEFLFMVNHLARRDKDLRREQGTKLRDWARDQDLPVIAVGDYNFDYSIDNGKGNKSMRNMLRGNAWVWIRPEELHQTQLASNYYNVLDFVFIANRPTHWKLASKILHHGFPFADTDETSDHRPVQCRILIGEHH